MDEVMTRAEAVAQFPDEWVLMDNTEGSNRGRVIAHDKNKKELLRKALGQTLPKELAVFFTGPLLPPGMKVMGLTPRGYVSAESVAKAI